MSKKKDDGSPFARQLREIKEKLVAAEKAAGKDASSRGAPSPAKGAPGRGPSPAAPPPRAAPRQTTNARPNAPAPAPDVVDDAVAFHRMVSGVTPLGHDAAKRIPRSQDSVEAASAGDAARRREGARAAVVAEADGVREHLRQLVEGGARFELRDDGQRVEGRRPDVPQDTFRALRRGNLPIDAQLDLHGFGAAEARDELEGFLRLVRNRGDRCVLVIHGKGDHAPRGVSVLRGEVAAWLAQGRASDHVAAFATAQPQDGGEGAVYVLLRR